MKMCRTLFGAIATVALMLLTLGTMQAQIWTEFDISIETIAYQPQGGTPIPPNDFVDIFSSFVNRDDGVTQSAIPLGFTFEYDGQVFDRIYISINGFASFQGRFIVNDPITLFEPTNGPNLTCAPYFGDHYLRIPSVDILDPQNRPYTPSTIYWKQLPSTADPAGRRAFVVEWEDLNINYFFDPNDPDNPFSPFRSEQAPSIATFQLWIYEADPNNAPSRRGTIEFHYGDAGTGSGVSIVKFSGSSVGIEDEPAVPNGLTTWINAVTFAETGDKDLARIDTRLTSNWPPTGLPGRIFRFDGDSTLAGPGWGDGDATLTQLDPNVPIKIREDQRLFDTWADVIRILRHKATRAVDFDSAFGRHGFHGDVNHDGRFYYSTSNYNNTGDSLDVNGDIVRYKVLYPIKDVNPQLPFPNDNTFNGFFFDADEFDASLIMLYLAAKLPVLPWLPDTLPHFTGKVLPVKPADNIVMNVSEVSNTSQVVIPVRLNGSVYNGSVGIAINAAPGTRIIDVQTPAQTDNQWVLSASGEDKVSIAGAGDFEAHDVVATLIVEVEGNGDVEFENIVVNSVEKGAMKLNLGEANGSSLNLSANYPNPFAPGATSSFDYNVPSAGIVTIRVFDLLGKEIATLVDAELASGLYTASWNGLTTDGTPVNSGIYYCRIESNGQSDVMTMQVQK